MMSSTLPHAHVGRYIFDRSIHTSGEKKEKQAKKKTTQMCTVQTDVNGTIEWHKSTNFLKETINIVSYSFTLSACFVVFFVNMDFKNVTTNNR